MRQGGSGTSLYYGVYYSTGRRVCQGVFENYFDFSGKVGKSEVVFICYMLLSCHRRQGNLHSTSECCERKALFATKETPFYVHFLPTSARNEPKKRRLRARGATNLGKIFANLKLTIIAEIFAIPYPLRIPLPLRSCGTPWWRTFEAFVNLIK